MVATPHPVIDWLPDMRPLQLHHIVNRAFVPHDKHGDIPLCFHALICDQCHLFSKMGSIDSPETREKLLAINAEMYGIDLIIESYNILNDMLPNGCNPNWFSIKKVEEIYNEQHQNAD